MEFFESIKCINDAELYKHSRQFPDISPDTIEKNFTLNDNEDKFNLDDQNINNIIIKTSDRKIDYIKKLISFYKENINNFNPNEKRLIIVILINVSIELNYELDFTGNYDLLFHQDLFPPNPNKTDLFDFIRKMNYLLYNLFSHIQPNQQEELLNTLNTIWEKNEINWIYNLFPFINQIIKNHNESVFTVFTDSSLYTDTFLKKSYEDSNLFNLVSKIFKANSKVFMNQEIVEYLLRTIERKEYREPLINWISTGLKFYSEMTYNQDDRKSVINKIFQLIIKLTAQDDLDLKEVNCILDSFTDPFLSLETPIFTNTDLINRILFQLSTYSKLSSDYFFKFLDLLTKLNDKFELFDNCLYDSVFENMKKNPFQKSDIEKLWQYTLKKDVNNDKILNWRGIELLLSYVEVDEPNIAEKLQSLIMIRSNLYELHKANLTTFLIKRIYEIHDNKKLFQAYYFVLELMVSVILTEKEMFGLLKLIKLNDFKYSIEVIQIFLNIIQKPPDQFNPKSFIRFDRENQFLIGPKRRITDSHSICFSFKLTQKVDDSIKYELISILHQEQKVFCSLYLFKNALNVEMINKEATNVSIVENFQIKNEEWNFIEISINNKFNLLKLRFNDTEKYIEYKIIMKRNSITDIFRKETNLRSYQISIKSSVFDYSNIFVISNSIEGKRPSFYYLMEKHKMDLMKIQSALPNNFNYCLYSTFKNDKFSNKVKLIRNFNLDNSNEIETNDVEFYGRTITNASNIFDIMDSIDLRKFFFVLFDKLKSNSNFTIPQGQSYLLKLLQIYESLNFSKTKTIELLSIYLCSIDCKFVSLSEINKCFDLWNSLKSRRIKREFLQSIFFNFSFVSKLKPEIQIKLFKKCSQIQHLDVKSFESLLFNAIDFYGNESDVSNQAWILLTKIFDPNNQNDIESLITTTMKNISIYVTKKCITILTDTITKIEINEVSKTKKMFALSVFLTSVNDIEIQTLGVKLFCLIERYFNIAENKSNIKQTPINSSKYIYQMILSSFVDYDSSKFDQLTQNIFNFFIPETLENQQEKQIDLNRKNSSSNEILESSNDIKISNITIFPLIVYYCSFCSNEIKNKLIDLFKSNTKTNYLSSLLDLNSWYFWITNFLFQYKSTNNNNDNSDLSFFIDPFVDFFTNEITFQSSTEKIVDLFLFLKNYSIKLNFDYRQIQLSLLIKLLTEFKKTNSSKEISVLYPIIYSCLQIEIKNNQFEFSDDNEYKIENKNEDLFNIFVNRFKNNFNFNFKSEIATNQNLRLLLIQSVLNLKENISVNLFGCDKSEIYLLTCFILVDYINENKNDDLINNYTNTILGLQTKYSKKYNKVLEILQNISNKELILNLEKQILSKYFQESKNKLKNKLKENNDQLLKDLQESEITSIQKENKNNQEICQLLLRKDKENEEFLKQKFDCYDSSRDEKIGREKLRIQRIQNSFINENSKNTIDRKYKILNQISIGGTRILMSINNTFTNHIDNKIKWLGKIEIKNSYKYQLSAYSKDKIKISLNTKLLTLTEVIDGILYIIENRIVFFSSLKCVEIPFHSISFIFNRVFSDLENEYQGCEIFTNENRSFYFVFNEKRDLFYQNLPDYNQYMQIVADKYQMGDQKKPIDLNFDETLKFDFLGNCRKICQSIYQTQNSSILLNQLNLANKWQNYIISNFEYIYYLNMLSNRSYHIGSRYPYYPSLLRQFDSEKIDINDESNYRNLCMPTIFHFKDRLIGLPLSSFPISDHSISYLLARVEPFTTLMFCINDQKFDARIFSNAKSMWDKEPMVSSPELIPEVYGLPFYLVNENKFEFGKKIDGEKIDDVTLPIWSKKNNFVFTAVQRLMLENDCSSKNMAKWIDMTFGVTQNTYDGQTLFLESKACLVGCLPDQIIKNRNHPDRLIRNNDENSATNGVSSSSGASNIGLGLAGLNDTIRSPLLNLGRDKNALNSAGFGDLEVKILGIEKEFIHFKKGSSSFVVDVNQNPFATLQVPDDSGDLLCVSRPLKLALFGVKNEDFLTVLNLQKKSVSLQCKTVAKILCSQTIGGKFVLTAGSDCIVRVWDMARNFCLVSSACFHEDEIVAVSGCRNTGIIASIDRSMNLVVETLYDRKLLAYVSLGEAFEKPLIQVTKSGIIVVAVKGQIQCLDSRGRNIQNFEIKCKDGLVTSINIYYDNDSRELIAAALNSGNVLLIDLTNFTVIGRNTVAELNDGLLKLCTMKKSRAILVSDGEKTKALLFGKLISPEISNDEAKGNNINVGEMESFCFNNEQK